MEVSPLSAYKFVSNDGETININYNKECEIADVQVNVNASCKGKLLDVASEII